MIIPVCNESFEKISELNCPLEVWDGSINSASIYYVVKATLANKRSANAHTKNKSMVQGGGKKPFKQKGTGRARQGSTRSPLQPGGGVVFGPQNASYKHKINKKVMLSAIKAILIDKVMNGKLLLVDKFQTDRKTKEVFKDLALKELLNSTIVSSSSSLSLVRNIETAKVLLGGTFSVYEAVKREYLIMEVESYNLVMKRLGVV